MRTSNFLHFEISIMILEKKIGNWSDMPFVILFDRFSVKNNKKLWEWESVCGMLCVVAWVCVCVCVCVLDHGRSRLFASRAVAGVVWMTMQHMTSYIDYLTSFCEPLSPPYRRPWDSCDPWRWGKRRLYLTLHCHHHNDPCIRMGSSESGLNVSLMVRDKVARQCPQTTTFRERGVLK